MSEAANAYPSGGYGCVAISARVYSRGYDVPPIFRKMSSDDVVQVITKVMMMKAFGNEAEYV